MSTPSRPSTNWRLPLLLTYKAVDVVAGCLGAAFMFALIILVAFGATVLLDRVIQDRAHFEFTLLSWAGIGMHTLVISALLINVVEHSLHFGDEMLKIVKNCCPCVIGRWERWGRLAHFITVPTILFTVLIVAAFGIGVEVRLLDGLHMTDLFAPLAYNSEKAHLVLLVASIIDCIFYCIICLWLLDRMLKDSIPEPVNETMTP